MKIDIEFTKELIKRWGYNLGPQSATESPIRFLVWAATIAAAFVAIASLLGLTSTNGLTAMTQLLWIALTLIFTALSESILQTISQSQAKRLRPSTKDPRARVLASASFDAPTHEVASSQLKEGELILVKAQEIIPADGEVVAGVATVDESALTGESAPVIREAGDDRNAVSAGTRIVSDQIIIRVQAGAHNSYVERMLRMLNMHHRQRSKLEGALQLFMALSTIIALALTVAIWAVTQAMSSTLAGQSNPIGMLEMIALFLCMSPTTLGALLPIVVTSGMMRLLKNNVMAKNASALESAGAVNTIIIDKTGTLTFGDRRAREFYPIDPDKETDFANAAQLASLADRTPEGRSILSRVKALYGLRIPAKLPEGLTAIDFSVQTRMSGVDIPEQTRIRKGTLEAIRGWLGNRPVDPRVLEINDRIAREGATPMVVANQDEILGVIALRDTLKGGLKERFEQLRRFGIKTIMVTGDNPLTAATIAAEAGVDDFIAEATPARKLELVRSLQSEGQTVAMSGDGTNDAPAMAQADVAMAMNSATALTKDACNLIDLDSAPTKLLNIVRIGKENIITTGAITTFSFASDAVKMLMLFPAFLAVLNPSLNLLNLIGFTSPHQAITVALVTNALIILGLLPLAISGVRFRGRPPQRLLGRHVVLYGLGGIGIPVIIMKLLQWIF